MSSYLYSNGAVHNDHHKEITINNPSGNVSDIVRAFMTEDVEPVQEAAPTEVHTYFKLITQKCISENRADSVEAEIRAACKGTAEGLWRTLWNNENLGYVVVQPIDATTLYRDIENHYGELPFKERQFRSARNKR